MSAPNSLYEHNPQRLPVPCQWCGASVTPVRASDPRRFCNRTCSAAHRSANPLPGTKPRRETSGRKAPSYALGDSTEGHTRQNIANNRGSIFPKRYGQ